MAALHVLAALALVGAASGQTPDQLEYFEKSVRPLLVANCQPCHNSKLKSSGLDLSTAAAFRGGGAGGGGFARTDGERGVWKAPAGLDATLSGVPELSVNLTDPENGELNPLGVNCLRSFPAAGRVVWGSRTRVGDDRLASGSGRNARS